MTNMKAIIAGFSTLAMVVVLGGCSRTQSIKEDGFRTYCNPMNLSYRFCLDEPSRREAADPSMVLFKDEYYLFASRSGGYFHSSDLINWDLIQTADLPIENYAPTAVVIGDEIYFLTSGDTRIYKTADPKSGKWQVAKENFSIPDTDPMLFLDDDGRLYYYYGCSNRNPIKAVELDRNSFNPVGEPAPCIFGHADEYGWERAGDYNDGEKLPWIEGSWMNKYNGKYYLQYATPGTEFKSYADAVYVSEQPLGPFTLAKVNPFACKPEGFANGAGHGSTFQDKYGNYWHIGTVTISVKHMFERRLSLFPVFFDPEGEMLACTTFGDYPFIVPDRAVTDVHTLSAGWMLLSYNKPVVVSSALADHPSQNAVNEDIRTCWSAETGNPGEFIAVDLGEPSVVHAVQINFAEQNTTLQGRNDLIRHQYLLEYSDDGEKWKTLIDKSENTIDAPHDYIHPVTPVKTRFIRLTNVKVPDGTLAVSGLRVFGTCDKQPAQAVSTLHAERLEDRRVIELQWEKSSGATGYNIRFGTRPDRLYQNYQVYGQNKLTIRSLHTGEPYFLAIDAFNENGVTAGQTIINIK
ncbi:MAG: family 43 glycosylhydrolase [Tannerella sp.]|jgi:hypothetical protein|nr:family 43 glycosylhydrolase [Tannerella sp.]